MLTLLRPYTCCEVARFVEIFPTNVLDSVINKFVAGMLLHKYAERCYARVWDEATSRASSRTPPF